MRGQSPTRKQVLESSERLVRRGRKAVSRIRKTIASTRIIIARSNAVIESVKRDQHVRTAEARDSA